MTFVMYLLHSGMVSMCGGCNLYEPWAAVLVGFAAGHCYMAVHLIMLRFQVQLQIKGQCHTILQVEYSGLSTQRRFPSISEKAAGVT